MIIGALFLTNPKKNDNVEENIATELSESSLTDQTLNTEKDSLADQESELNALLKSSPMRFGHNNKVSYKPGRMHFVTGTEQRLTVCAWTEQEKNDEGAAACDRRRRYHLWMVKPVANVGYVG